MGQGVVSHKICEVISLSGFRSQELSACGNVEEKIANGDRRPTRMSRVFNVAHPSAIDSHTRRRTCAFDARRQLHSRNRRNRRECLAAKSERTNRSEILSLANLRGRVAFESKHRIIAHHAFAVVRHFQQAPAASFDLDRDARGAGIDRVLYQLFGH